MANYIAEDLEIADGEPLPNGMTQCMQCEELFDHKPVRQNGWPYCSQDCKELIAMRIAHWLR